MNRYEAYLQAKELASSLPLFTKGQILHHAQNIMGSYWPAYARLRAIYALMRQPERHYVLVRDHVYPWDEVNQRPGEWRGIRN
jgi:hypothetical protein